MQVTTW